MDPFTQGYETWQRGEPDQCPYEPECEEHEQWWAGWRQAEIDNGQFGVGT